MNFITKTATDEIANAFDAEIDKLQKDSENVGNVTADITSYLTKAAILLMEAGLFNEADIIRIVAEDPATKGLTSEKCVKNLKERGIVLNLPTDKATDLPKEMKGKEKTAQMNVDYPAEEITKEVVEEVPEEADKPLEMEGVKIFHADHGISQGQLKYIVEQLKNSTKDGFFIQEVKLPAELGSVPCGIYGPVMGDPPVTDAEVTMESRGLDRTWKDRMINKPTRPVDYVQAIGARDGDQFTLYTIYGGPLAPQNPDDPGNRDKEGSQKFWSEHALSSGKSASENPADTNEVIDKDIPVEDIVVVKPTKTAGITIEDLEDHDPRHLPHKHLPEAVRKFISLAKNDAYRVWPGKTSYIDSLITVTKVPDGFEISNSENLPHFFKDTYLYTNDGKWMLKDYFDDQLSPYNEHQAMKDASGLYSNSPNAIEHAYDNSE